MNEYLFLSSYFLGIFIPIALISIKAGNLFDVSPQKHHRRSMKRCSNNYNYPGNDLFQCGHRPGMRAKDMERS